MSRIPVVSRIPVNYVIVIVQKVLVIVERVSSVKRAIGIVGGVIGVPEKLQHFSIFTP